MTAVNRKMRTQPHRGTQLRRRTQPRRRTQLGSRRKHAICRKTQCKRLLPKKRQQPLKREKQGKTVIKRVKPEWDDLKNPTDAFIIKVLRKLHRDKVAISTKAKGKIITFIRKFYNKVYNKARCSSRCKESCVIGSKELENALKRVLREKQAIELAKTVRNTSRRH